MSTSQVLEEIATCAVDCDAPVAVPGSAIPTCTVVLKGVAIKVHQAKSVLLEESARYAIALSATQAHTYPPEWKLDVAPTAPLTLCARVSLVRDCKEWQDVATLFHTTMPKSTLVSIERLQNKRLHELFSFRLKSLSEEIKGEPARLPLFHGTNMTDPKEVYDSSQGFMLNFASAGEWGYLAHHLLLLFFVCVCWCGTC